MIKIMAENRLSYMKIIMIHFSLVNFASCHHPSHHKDDKKYSLNDEIG